MLEKFFYLSGIATFIFLSYFTFIKFQQNKLTPIGVTVTPSVSVSGTSPSITVGLKKETFCTQDSQCPSGYQCQAYQSTYTSCEGNLTGCHPQQVIIKGYCKASRRTSCKSNADCVSGLICHQSGGIVSHKSCEEVTNYKKCSGIVDTSCGAGYHCARNCGAIIVQGNEPDPGYSCIVNEQKEYTCPQ